MLGTKSVAAMLPVRDLAAAQDFYENTLGLEQAGDAQGPGALVYRCGPSAAVVYQSQYAGTNQATAATWACGDDFDAIVQDLDG